MSVLAQRILTAVLLIPVVTAITWFSGTAVFAGSCAMVILIGAWEWANLAGIDAVAGRVAYTLLLCVTLVVCYVFRNSALALWLPAAGVAWWVFAFCQVVYYQRQGRSWLDSAPARVVAGLPVLVPVWFSIVSLHSNSSHGPLLVLMLLVMIWLADSAAYFVGQRWGRTRLASRVSPGKSWEGVLGALGVTLIVIPAFMYWSGISADRPLIYLVICLVTVAVSILGDLFESMLKRIVDKKDSGTAIPGHGGILDRIDSLTAAVPVFFTAYAFIRVVP